MAGMDWFRWHHGSVTDPKFQLVARKTKARVADVIAVWACILEEASQAEERGNPGVIDFESIDCLLGLDDGQAMSIHTAMGDRSLVTPDGRVASWDKRQPKREREDNTNADRQRAFKAKHSQVTPGNATVTPGNAKKHLEESREEESREDKKTEDRERASPTGSRLPADWALPDDWADWAKQNRPDLATSETAVRFSDYWHSVAGAKGRKADWQATWRNWVRNEKTSPSKPSQAESFKERDDRNGRERWEQMTGRRHPDNMKTQAPNVIDVTPFVSASKPTFLELNA